MSGRLRAAALGLLLARGVYADETRVGGAAIQAPLIELDEGVARGEGGITAQLGDQVLTGARFSYDITRGLLIVENGTWTRPEGALSFTRAEIQLPRGLGVVIEGSYQGREGRLRVSGEALAWEGEGRLTGRGVRFTTCDCEAPPWELSAREVTVVLDDEVRYSGAWLNVCGKAVLPVPAGAYPLAERKSGLLPPTLAWGEDGLVGGLPIYLVLGPAADLTLQPELRTDQGARALAELRLALPEDGGVRLAGAAGWDWREGRARGAFDLEQGYAVGDLRTAARASLWSDVDYLGDYGTTLLGRATPFAEGLGLVGWRALRVESDVFQDDQRVAQRPISGVFQRSGRPVGPVSTGVEARLDLLSTGAAPWLMDAPAARARVAASGQWGEWLGPLRADALLEGRATSWIDGDPWADGRAQARVALPFWSPHAGGITRVELIALGGVAAPVGEVDARLPDDVAPPAWIAGPALAARRVGPRGVPLSAELRLPLTPDGLDPQGELRLVEGGWTVRAHGDREIQETSIAWDDGPHRVGLGGVRTSALTWLRAEAAANLPAPLSGWRPSWRATWDAVDARFLSQGPGLAWSSPCDCLDLAATATWSQDRALPDLGFDLRVR